ncbi:ribose-phosphate diphosphokinase [Pseudomonas sp. P8_250]|uniref:ribose-phosphate diphosphokinase n=1 Tax=Pseudomonas sp. P8_250 TaxID=3043446 RepID=UPI002A3609F0|nr:ribose-phosphate diphosphokinase [Pseudomonas sp. P8_250]MDX9668678.1 ribose-phosphate diphosphokinase [Pseudomonas sp. P8_250]
MIKYRAKGITTFVDVAKFPGGEVKVNINVGSKDAEYGIESVEVSASLQTSDDIIALLLATDALRRHYPRAELDLILPYIPYARQDRPCVNGEALSIAVMANLINSCGFSTVEVIDSHSDVAPALIRNCKNYPQSVVFNKILYTFEDFYIVAPDAGAYKKAHSLAKSLSAKGVICANKVRDVATGRIESVSITENVEGLNLLVADDLCDGGRTFTELAEILRKQNCARLELVVTHGLFTKGVAVLTEPGMYDKVYTTNSYHSNATGNVDGQGIANDKVQWIKVV